MVRKKRFASIPQLSLRALILGALGSALIAVSSVYVALRLSALPWPTVFVTVLAMGLLKLLGRSNSNEMNIVGTGMSAGAMVAGGLAFTIPALWISGVFPPRAADQPFGDWFWPKFWPVLAVALIGVSAGTLLCWRLRKKNLKRNDLPYPIGQAAAETLKAGDRGGVGAGLLFAALGLSALFTVLRDRFQLIREEIGGWLGPLPIAFSLSPMALAIGYIIGFGPAAWWLVGNLIAKVGFAVYGVAVGSFATAADAASFSLTAAVGLMVGSGLGIVIVALRDLLQNRTVGRRLAGEAVSADAPDRRTSRLKGGLPAVLVAGLVFLLSILIGLSVPVSLLLIAGLAFATAMSSLITGQTGINPMEIFGIIVLLAVRLFFPLGQQEAFFVVAAVAVACGYTGDMMNDYKSGQIMGTDPRAQLIAELVSALVGTVAAVVALFAIVHQYGCVGAGSGLTAAQAHTVAALVSGIGDPLVFATALLLGTLLYLKGIPAMIVGIGMILSQGLSLAIFLGGLLSLILNRVFQKNETHRARGQIVAAGLLGGEGIAGTLIAFLTLFGR